MAAAQQTEDVVMHVPVRQPKSWKDRPRTQTSALHMSGGLAVRSFRVQAFFEGSVTGAGMCQSGLNSVVLENESNSNFTESSNSGEHDTRGRGVWQDPCSERSRQIED